MPSGVSVTINRKYVQNYNQGVGLQLLSKTVYLPALMFITAALYDKLIRDVTGFLSEKLLTLARRPAQCGLMRILSFIRQRDKTMVVP